VLGSSALSKISSHRRPVVSRRNCERAAASAALSLAGRSSTLARSARAKVICSGRSAGIHQIRSQSALMRWAYSRATWSCQHRPAHTMPASGQQLARRLPAPHEAFPGPGRAAMPEPVYRVAIFSASGRALMPSYRPSEWPGPERFAGLAWRGARRLPACQRLLVS
jgi:hypothetical protein